MFLISFITSFAEGRMNIFSNRFDSFGGEFWLRRKEHLFLLIDQPVLRVRLVLLIDLRHITRILGD